MRRFLLILITIAIAALFISCNSSKSTAVRHSAPTELTAEQLQKFAILMGVEINDIILIDKEIGLVIVSGNMNSIDNLRFMLHNTSLHGNLKPAALETLTEQVVSNKKRRIIVYVLDD
ncbi:MAG: hypothetical protein LBL47_01395 [Lactobacillus sp.]|jgi:hypothetical protein|nr:hypothetical protein [Lactobacillus sp.]